MVVKAGDVGSDLHGHNIFVIEAIIWPTQATTLTYSQMFVLLSCCCFHLNSLNNVFNSLCPQLWPPSTSQLRRSLFVLLSLVSSFHWLWAGAKSWTWPNYLSTVQVNKENLGINSQISITRSDLFHQISRRNQRHSFSGASLHHFCQWCIIVLPLFIHLFLVWSCLFNTVSQILKTLRWFIFCFWYIW